MTSYLLKQSTEKNQDDKSKSRVFLNPRKISFQIALSNE